MNLRLKLKGLYVRMLTFFYADPMTEQFDYLTKTVSDLRINYREVFKVNQILTVKNNSLEDEFLVLIEAVELYAGRPTKDGANNLRDVAAESRNQLNLISPEGE